MKVLVTGSHGLIGSALIPVLQQNGHTVTRLVRSSPGPGEARWDPERGTIDRAALEGVDAVVHLAGVGIGDHRWTEEHKRAVLDSRVKGTRLLSETLATLDSKPVLVSGSAVGYYGNRGDEQLTETSAPG
ncbi:MAG: NAD-dependent epimerase/dehydratase family protein, partial [Actinobacteria bacterium]|nr:NAD-dependent epimerase/dehydratase family protein [Actinomycetota bacterium]